MQQGFAYLEGNKAGRELERARAIKLARGQICFGHRDTGNCEHSVCFGMDKLINWLETGYEPSWMA